MTMTLTEFLVIFDTLAAIALFLLIIVTARQEDCEWTLKEKRMARVRRVAYAMAAITMAYRVWDIIDSGRDVSFIGGMTNMVMTSAILMTALTRLVLR